MMAFDVAHETLRACIESAKYIHALDPTAFKEHRWKPATKPQPEDFICDFYLAGHQALDKKGLHSRVVLFDIYFMGNATYIRARNWFGLSEMGWVHRTEEIRRIVGAELIEREIFPPQKYFTELGRTKRQ